MKGKIEGKIMVLPTLADTLPLFETIYIKRTSLIVFQDGDVFIEPSTTYFVKEINLLEDYSLPIFVDEGTIIVKMQDINFIYYSKGVEEKEMLSEEAIFCGNITLEHVFTKEQIFSEHSFESIFNKLISCLEEAEYDTISEFFFTLLSRKAKTERVTTIYACKEFTQVILSNFVESITEPDAFSIEYKNRLVEIMKFLSTLLPKKHLLTRRLAEEKLEEGQKLYIEERKLNVKKKLHYLNIKFCEAKAAEDYEAAQIIFNEIRNLKTELANMQK